MAINPIIISSFQWGLANDKNTWPKGAFWDAQGIEIRKNSEYVTLNRGVTNVFSTGTSKINVLALTNYSWLSVQEEINAFCEDGKIYNRDEWEIYPSWTAILNVVSNGIYNYIIRSWSIDRFQYSVKKNILPTDSFATNWTGTNWSFSSWALHTTGSTTQLSQIVQTLAIIWEKYHITCSMTSTTGTVTVDFWGVTSSTLSQWVNNIYLTAVSTWSILFTPTTTFDGTISYIRVDRTSDLVSSDWQWVKPNVSTLTSSIAQRPVLNFYWDLIIWDGTQVARYNKDGTTYLFSSTQENPVIGWLDGTVYAITQIGANIYVWCNNWGSTNMYIWDWFSSRPTQKVTYADKPVINVALLNNQHYWWSQKWPMSQKNIMIGEWYQAQRYITSDIPKAYGTETLDDPDRLALYGTNTNAIETFGDIVYLPWYGKIYWFGAYFPWDPIALNKEFTFLGSECTAMLTTSTPTLLQDYTFYMIIAYKDLSNNYQVGIIDFRDYDWTYISDWYLESMEYLGGNLWIEKEQKKLLVPFYLPHSSTSIEVYERKNQASSYTLIKTINTTAYWTGFNVAEIADSWKWNTIQWKFKLITSNATYSPRLYVGITDIFLDTANRNG